MFTVLDGDVILDKDNPDKVVACLNENGRWSVDWTKANAFMNAKLDQKNQVIVNFSTLLVGVKDKLPPEEKCDAWPYRMQLVGYADFIDAEHKMSFIMGHSATGHDLAHLLTPKEGPSGMEWKIDWESVKEFSDKSLDNWKQSALIAMCRLFILGKNRFQKIPNGNYRLKRKHHVNETS